MLMMIDALLFSIIVLPSYLIVIDVYEKIACLHVLVINHYEP